jgi:transposase
MDGRTEMPLFDSLPVMGSAPVDLRELKGLEIAARSRIEFKDGVWLVPSQTTTAKYHVVLKPEGDTCDCEDFQLTQKPCKHVHAARLVRTRDHGGQSPKLDTDVVPKKKTYAQNWPVYNAAQAHEKDHFQELLADLSAAIPEPPRKGGSKGGRPPAPLCDAIFVCVFKVFTTFSARRFMSDLRESHRRGHIQERLSPDIAWKYLQKAEVTPILHELIRRSSLPLRSVDVDFAVDSSGFGTSKFERWYDEKYGTTRLKAEWVKTHLCCGVKTGIVTTVVIGDKNAADCPQFPELTKKTAENFTIREMSGDKAYLSAENLALVDGLGGVPYIPFKSNSQLGNTPLWDRMFHYFQMRRDEFLAHYHKRSNVESVFSAVKRKFGDAVRSRKDTAMINEALAQTFGDKPPALGSC